MNRRRFLLAAQMLGTQALVACAMRGAGAETNEAWPAEPLRAASFSALRKFVRTECGEIAYVERGQGKSALFLHGFPLNGFQWRGAIDHLAPFRRCIAPDFLGLGHTRIAADQPVGPDSQVQMLASLLDALSVAQVDVIASDSGGAVAQLFAVRHPARVRTLLLTNCDTELECPPAAMLPVIELAKTGRFVDEWLAPWWANPSLARSDAGIGGMCYADRCHPTNDALDMYFGPVVSSAERKANLHRYAIALERNALAGIGPELGRSRIPVRIVWGTGDRIFRPANADHLDRSFGNSRGVRRLEGAKLFWPEERPDILAAQARILWQHAERSV
jgi:haloalkane dehalogenase